MDRSIRQELVIERKVVATEGKSTTLELRINALKLDLTDSGKQYGYDSGAQSADPQSEGLAQSLRRVLNIPITVTLDGDDDVVEIKGNVSDDPAKPLPATIMGDPFLREVLRPLYRLPSSPAAARPGQRWDRVDAMDSPPIGTMKTVLTHTLDSVEGHSATISFKGALTLSPAIGNSARKTRITGQEITGSCVWNAEAGTLEKYERTDRVDLEVESVVGDVPFSSRTVTTFERVRRDGK